MDAFLSVLGTMFFMFLVLATAVEAVLEVFRGVLERLGITFLKGKYSLDDALKLTGEFATGNDALKAKVAAVRTVAEGLGTRAGAVLTDLDNLQIKQMVDDKLDADAAAALSKLSSDVKKIFEDSESKRIFILRLLSTVLGCLLVWQSGFYVLELLKSTPGVPAEVANMPLSSSPLLNALIGGLAAAAGSSYWHDQLDKIRNLKDIDKQLSAMSAT